MGGKKRGLATLVALVAAFALALGLAAPAWAATGNLVIKINNTETGHKYEAFQIFSGTRDSDGKVTNLGWGDGVDSSDLVSALSSSTYFSSISSSSSAADVAAALSNYTNDSAGAQEFARIAAQHLNTSNASGTTTENRDGTYTISGLDHGYYLVRDTADSAGNATRWLLDLANTSADAIAIDVKTSTPTVIKKVKENDKQAALGDATYESGYNDVADYGINEDVPFKLIGTIPDMSAYTNYYYAFEDTTSDGIDLPDSGYKVYLTNGVSVAVGSLDTTATVEGVDVTSSWSVQVKNKHSVSIATENLKGLLSNYSFTYTNIIVTYNGKLNSSAVIGTATPENTNEVHIEYSNNPNGSGHGQSKPDNVIVFTYEVDVTKVGDDESDLAQATKLAGAKFKLQRADNKYAVLDSNNALSGWVDDANDATELESNGNGLFTIKGLDAGTYTLTETAAPSSYQLAQSSWTLVVTATTNNGQNSNITKADLQGMQASLSYGGVANSRGSVSVNSDNKGIINAYLVNSTQFELPITGGAGTIALTVAGVTLVAGAAIVLSIRKRANDEQ